MISFEGLPEKAIPTDGSDGYSESTQEQRNAREIAQARLEWQTRAGNSLSLTVRWRRFYRTHTFRPGQLKVIQAQLETRIAELRAVTDTPEPYVSGATWTQAMEKLENLEAEVSVVRRCLRDGGSE